MVMKLTVQQPDLRWRRKMIEDIKVEQKYGWVTVFNTDGSAEKTWAMTSYRLLVKRRGQWTEVPVEHINPHPPEGPDAQ